MNLEATGPSSYLPPVRKALELSKALERLHFSANGDERRELVSHVCSNLFLRGKKVDFTYKKPFDLLAEGLQSAKWLPESDACQNSGRLIYDFAFCVRRIRKGQKVYQARAIDRRQAIVAV